MTITQNIAAWAGGSIAALAFPFALKWLGGKGIAWLKAWEMGKVQELLAGKTGDPALDQFNHDLVLAVAKLMQAKMPKDGLGPERKKALMDFLVNKFPWFAGKEAALSDLADKVVEMEASVLDSIKPPAQP